MSDLYAGKFTPSGKTHRKRMCVLVVVSLKVADLCVFLGPLDLRCLVMRVENRLALSFRDWNRNRVPEVV